MCLRVCVRTCASSCILHLALFLLLWTAQAGCHRIQAVPEAGFILLTDFPHPCWRLEVEGTKLWKGWRPEALGCYNMASQLGKYRGCSFPNGLLGLTYISPFGNQTIRPFSCFLITTLPLIIVFLWWGVGRDQHQKVFSLWIFPPNLISEALDTQI